LETAGVTSPAHSARLNAIKTPAYKHPAPSSLCSPFPLSHHAARSPNSAVGAPPPARPSTTNSTGYRRPEIFFFVPRTSPPPTARPTNFFSDSFASQSRREVNPRPPSPPADVRHCHWERTSSPIRPLGSPSSPTSRPLFPRHRRPSEPHRRRSPVPPSPDFTSPVSPLLPLSFLSLRSGPSAQIRSPSRISTSQYRRATSTSPVSTPVKQSNLNSNSKFKFQILC
jgi:hypothetical protein